MSPSRIDLHQLRPYPQQVGATVLRQLPHYLEIDKEEAVLQIYFACSYEAHLSYDDSATASYDEGDLVYVEHRDEDVEREDELEVEVRISFDPKDLDTVEVIEVSLTEPSKGFGIKTQNDHDWPYK